MTDDSDVGRTIGQGEFVIAEVVRRQGERSVDDGLIVLRASDFLESLGEWIGTGCYPESRSRE